MRNKNLPYHGDNSFLSMPVDVREYRKALIVAMCLAGLRSAPLPLTLGLEIGLGWGASALTFLEFFPEAKLLSADLNEALPARKELEARFPDRFHFFNPAAEKINGFNTVQWLYIDGGHEYKEVVRDIREWYPWLQVGGVLCFDDYDNPDCPGVRVAVDEFSKQNKIEIQQAGGPTGIVFFVKEK